MKTIAIATGLVLLGSQAFGQSPSGNMAAPITDSALTPASPQAPRARQVIRPAPRTSGLAVSASQATPAKKSKRHRD